jgi:Lactate racemase N-terminal domain
VNPLRTGRFQVRSNSMEILDPIDFPQMIRVRQKFDPTRLRDVPATILGRIRALAPELPIRPGQRVALACPSRGLADYSLIVKAVVTGLRELKLEPFIIPAMGSHGAATARGQERVLHDLGITESAVGAPIRSSLEVVSVGKTEQGVSVNIDRLAHEADHIVPINRIKEHTGFEADIQSGLMKIMVIGLGKTEGARRYHHAMVSHGYHAIIMAGARTVLRNCNILFGVGSIENAYYQVADVGVFKKEEIEDLERAFLAKYKAIKATLPFEFAHVLMIEEVGKEIAGHGFDTKVIGRIGSYLSPDPEKPVIKRIMVSDLTDATKGNASGVGTADVITRRLHAKIDHETTNINNIVSAQLEVAKTPLIMENDRDALRVCMMTVGLTPYAEQKIMRIKNTLYLDEVDVSRAYAPELENRGDLEIIVPARSLTLEKNGYFAKFAATKQCRGN